MSGETHVSSMMDKVANNATLMVSGRILMVLASLIGIPLLLSTISNVSDLLSKLRDDIVDIRIQQANTKSEISNLKTLSEYQLRSFDDRLSAQSRRMDGIEKRLDYIERMPRHSGPAFPPAQSNP